MKDRLKILHLEGRDARATPLSDILENLDQRYERYTVHTRENYIHAVEAFFPDIILADENASLSLHQALQLLKQKELVIPFILLIAEETEDHALELLKAGATDYVIKKKLQRLPFILANYAKQQELAKALLRAGTLQEKTSKELERVNHELEGLFNAVNEGFYSRDLINNRYIHITAGYEKIYGYSMERFFAQPDLWYEVIHPDDKHIIEKSIVVLRTGKAVKNVYRIIHGDQSIRWIEVRVVPVLEDGVLVRVDGVVSDITERKNARQQIIDSERRYRRLFEQNIAGVYTTSLAGLILECNTAFAEMLGYKSPENLIGQNISAKYLFPDRRLAIIQKLRDKKRLYNYESTLIRKDGQPLHLLVNTYLFADPVLKEEVCEGMVLDITDRKIFEQQILKTRANLRTLFDNTDTAHILINGNLQVISFNLPAKRISEMHKFPKLVAGCNLLDYFPEKRRPELQKVIRKVLNGEQVVHEITLKDEEDKEHWYTTKWVSVANTENRNWGFILSLRDITGSRTSALERDQINSELIKRNKNLEQFTYIVSHNLRAPVANIISLTELLKDLNTDGQGSELVEGLSTSIKTLDTIIKDLNHTLQVKDNLNRKREEVYFQQLMDEITFSINNLIVIEDVQINCDFTAAPSLFTVRGYLYSIFYNITLNSIKYRKAEETPVITISSKIDKHQLTLYFRDNGKGIDMEKHGAQLFGLYKRFDTSIEGKGMGMFMVKTQIEELHGSIEVQSELGEGTTIIIRLPHTRG